MPECGSGRVETRLREWLFLRPLPKNPGSPMFRAMMACTPLPREIPERPGSGPDFSHVEAWVFDLDNTLYEGRVNLLKVVEKRICAFVTHHCRLPQADAFRLQKSYYLTYGNTLAGLMAHHDVDPEAYLAFVNDVDVSTLEPDPSLAAALSRLPGRLFVFTNNCGRYAERVLAQLGIFSMFDAVFDIRRIGFAPKPDPTAYRAIVQDATIAPSRAAMFDDLPVNLAPAHALGMTTVCVGGMPAHTTHIHHYTDDLPGFLGTLALKGSQ